MEHDIMMSSKSTFELTTERIKKADSRFRVNANFPSGKHIIRLPSIGLAAKCQDEGEGILARSEVKPRARERASDRPIAAPQRGCFMGNKWD